MAPPHVPVPRSRRPSRETRETKARRLVKHISEFDLMRPPSCIQFVPDFKYADYFVVGTYQLEPDEVSVERTDPGSMESPSRPEKLGPEKQIRNGTLSLLKYMDVEEELRLVDTVVCTSAVYDLHFLPGKTTTFATASSTGAISFYHVVDSKRSTLGLGKVLETNIEPLWSAQIFSPTTIVTYFEFIPAQRNRFGPLISATTNDGGVYLISYCLENLSLDILNNGKPITEHKLRFLGTPDFAWCCASYASPAFCIYSGGDDGGLIQETFPIKDGQLDPGNRVSQVHRIHTAGVTAILPLPVSTSNTSALILTGSYDEHVQIYSVEEKKVLAKLNLGGGVYRLKFTRQHYRPDGTASHTILACCMHAGTKILHIQMDSFSKWKIEVDAYLDVPGNNAENYCYAADVRPAQINLEAAEAYPKGLCVSGTFVDKRLVVWEFPYNVPRDT